MPAHIDEPAPHQTVDPWCFLVHGWIWLGPDQGEIAAVEAWIGDQFLGETSSFHARLDANEMQGVPVGTPIGFLIQGCRTPERDGTTADVHISVRRHNGRRLGPLARTQAVFGGGATSPLGGLLQSVSPGACGLEIGAHSNPVPGLTPYYTDSVAAFAGSSGRADFLADATALPLPDNTLEYLCSSHVLEHLPNPLGALHEWHRVLRPGGWLYLVVPDKRYTFDVGRTLTPTRHLLDDLLHSCTAEDSADHIDEFVFHADWKLLCPNCPPGDEPQQRQDARARYLDQLRQEKRVDIHFHTFTARSLRVLLWAAGLIECANARFTLAAHAERFPGDRRDGIGMLLRKTGGRRSRPELKTHHVRHEDSTVAPLPIVCPVTLKPLEIVSGSDGSTLVAAGEAARYKFAGALPNLIPPMDALIARAWARRSVRWFQHVMSLGRLAVAPRL